MEFEGDGVDGEVAPAQVSFEVCTAERGKIQNIAPAIFRSENDARRIEGFIQHIEIGMERIGRTPRNGYGLFGTEKSRSCARRLISISRTAPPVR